MREPLAGHRTIVIDAGGWLEINPLQVEWDLAPESKNIEVTPSLLARSMFYYVQAIGKFVALRHYYTRRSQYHSFLLLWTSQGQGKLQYRGKDYALPPGSVFLVDCKEPHCYKTEGAARWKMHWVHFNGSGSQSHVELIMRNAGPVHGLTPDSCIPKLFGQLLQAHRTRRIQSDILASKWITDMLTELLLKSVNGSAGPSDLSGCPAYIMEMMNQMERNCGAKITLDELAARHSFSKYHLAREFKRYTGYSPNEYLTHVRLSSAKEMLKFSDLPVAQISEQAGYNRPSFFIKTFKHREGMTPLEFRRFWRS